MKRKSLITMILLLSIICLANVTACGKKNKSKEESNDKISIVCTAFSQYDWVNEIIGEKKDLFEITLLLDNGVDLHSYQPTAEDIAIIGECDIFIYIGGLSDIWVDDVLKQATNKNMKVINMIEVLGDNAKEEELVEGMQGEDEDADHDHEDADNEIEYDEHVWLSLKNASIFVEIISAKIAEIDSTNKDIYNDNTEEYIANLNDLDTKYQNMVSEATRNIILFGDRFPFRYLVDDYNIDYYAAFVGCSAESEASFETVAFLSKKADELDLPVICIIENSDKKIAQTIINTSKNKNQEIIMFNSLQSVTSKDLDNGISYLDIMNSNYEELKKALY